MATSRTYEGECFPLISSQWNPLEDEAQLDWIFCLASSLERINTSLGDGCEARVDAPVLLVPSSFPETHSISDVLDVGLAASTAA